MVHLKDIYDKYKACNHNMILYPIMFFYHNHSARLVFSCKIKYKSLYINIIVVMFYI